MVDEPETWEDDRAEPRREGAPFDSIEGAAEYVALLADAIAESEAAIQQDLAEARAQGADRRAEALHIVAFKLEKLRGHVTSSRRLLNDLRSLRRLLLGERRRA